MITVDLPGLVNRLHPMARHGLESAAAQCVSLREAEITVAQVLLQLVKTPLSDVRQILIRAEIDAEALCDALDSQPLVGQDAVSGYPAFSPLLVEWLKDSWLLASAELGHSELRSGALLLALLQTPHRYLSACAVQLLLKINAALLRSEFAQWTAGSAESVTEGKPGEASASASAQNDSLLARFTSDLTKAAREGRLDPVLCRDAEIDLMIDILCRRRKNNPIVVGEAGVGKSALIEGLALRILAEQVPDKLRNTRLLTLDLGAMQAGAAVKGEFEKRFKGVMAEVTQSAEPVILFIDEAHTLIGAGNQQGGLDVSNLLKPALARGELKTIAATTWSEYKKYIEKDAALSRRFQVVKVSEPSAAEAVIILRGLRSAYEKAHSVLIDDDALQAAANLSERYLSGRQLPDKAIDVLDTACARVAINFTSPPRQLSALNTERHQLSQQIAQLEREQRIALSDDPDGLSQLRQRFADSQAELDELATAWQQQQELVQKIIALRTALLAEEHEPEREQAEELVTLMQELEALQKERLLVSPHVGRQQIAAVIAEWTGVPLNRLSQNELTAIAELPEWLGEAIRGQSLAIRQLHKHLLTARADLRRPGRPLGAFLLVGPSGVGKTESVLQIADTLFGGRRYLTTINMSEFQEKHTVSRLIGSPPGYVGYGEGGVLTEAIRQKPYSVVLLDEVEKAHPDVLNLFYQAFDKGELADGEGRVIDCKNILFFLTSNLGYEIIVEHASEAEKLPELLYPVLSDFFRPALLARMEVVPFLPLDHATLTGIITSKLARLETLLTERFGAGVDIDESVVPEVMRRVTRTENGARMLESVIDGALLPPLAQLLLQQIAAGGAIARIRIFTEEHEFSAQVDIRE